MFESHSLERKLFPPLVSSRTLLFSLLVCALGASAAAQTSNTTALEAYATAMKQSRISDRISAMESFLAVGGNSTLKADALEILAWDYRQMNDMEKSRNSARQLLALDAENPIALALLSEKDDQSGGAPRNVSENQFNMATRGLNGLGRMRPPEAMLSNNYIPMRQQMIGMLNGIAGLGYLDHNDLENARNHLKQAVAIDPNNPRYVYGLALALLLAKKPDAADGYWYLARAVNLTKGTPSGQQVSTYARTRYHHDGGRDADWDQFLAVTAGPRSDQPAAAVRASAAAPDAASPAKSKGLTQPAAVTAVKSTRSGVTQPAATQDSTLVAGIVDHPELKSAVDNDAKSQVAEVRKNSGPGAPNAPVSLGILVQTALLGNSNRHEIISAISEMVQRLRPEDEAFIMAFSNQLDFEQDLTANDKLLEDAMANLKPRPGAKLLDGIQFAAGHLKRIGKNPNRVLLIISDGRNSGNEAGSTLLSAQLKEVRIDCIGLDVVDPGNKALLERLAAYSGGHASFAADSQQFRTAASQIADSMGMR